METIEVRYGYISGIPTPWDNFHKSILYTNSNGERFVVEALPTNRPDTFESLVIAETGQGSPYGLIKAESHPDKDPYDPAYTETIKTGSDLSNEWDTIKQSMTFIGNGNIPYKPWSQNSNYAVDEVLKMTGLPLPERDNTFGSGYFSPGSQLDGLLGDLVNTLAALRNIGEWKNHLKAISDILGTTPDPLLKVIIQFRWFQHD